MPYRDAEMGSIGQYVFTEKQRYLFLRKDIPFYIEINILKFVVIIIIDAQNLFKLLRINNNIL